MVEEIFETKKKFVLALLPINRHHLHLQEMLIHKIIILKKGERKKNQIMQITFDIMLNFAARD